MTSSGGNSSFKLIIHASAPWKKECPRANVELGQIAYKSLQECDNIGLKSLAIPPLGTGIAGCSIDDCANGFIEGFSRYLKENQYCSVNKIGIIIYDAQTLSTFNMLLGQIDFTKYVVAPISVPSFKQRIPSSDEEVKDVKVSQ